MAWSPGRLRIFLAFRLYIQAAGRARAVTWAMVSANVINWLSNWLLIRGRLEVVAARRRSAIASGRGTGPSNA